MKQGCECLINIQKTTAGTQAAVIFFYLCMSLTSSGVLLRVSEALTRAGLLAGDCVEVPALDHAVC